MFRLAYSTTLFITLVKFYIHASKYEGSNEAQTPEFLGCHICIFLVLLFHVLFFPFCYPAYHFIGIHKKYRPISGTQKVSADIILFNSSLTAL